MLVNGESGIFIALCSHLGFKVIIKKKATGMKHTVDAFDIPHPECNQILAPQLLFGIDKSIQPEYQLHRDMMSINSIKHTN